MEVYTNRNSKGEILRLFKDKPMLVSYPTKSTTSSKPYEFKTKNSPAKSTRKTVKIPI